MNFRSCSYCSDVIYVVLGSTGHAWKVSLQSTTGRQAYCRKPYHK